MLTSPAPLAGFPVGTRFAAGETPERRLWADPFNHLEFSNPDTNIGDPSFGQISNTADPRILQVALHLKF